MSSENESANPPLPPLMDFAKPKGPDFRMLPLGIGLGLALGLLARALELSGHEELYSFLNSLNWWPPLAVLLEIAGAESILLVRVLGQLLASTALRWKIIAISLGPIRLSRNRHRWRVAVSKSFVSHSVASVPMTPLPPGWHFGIIVAAASGSLLLASAFALLGYSHFSAYNWSRGYFAAAALFGFGLTLFSLIPNARRTGRGWNAGRFCLALITRDPELQNRLTTLRLFGLAQQRGRPADAPVELIKAAAQPAIDITDAVIRASTIANWCLDRKDLASAECWYERLGELAQFCGPVMRSAAMAASACFDLAWRDDREKAMRKLRDVNPELLSTSMLRLCTQALFGILEGSRRKAETAIALAESECVGPFGDYQRETLARLRTIAEGVGSN